MKRARRRIVLFLLLGAIINVAVAWRYVLRTDINVDGFTLEFSGVVVYGTTQLDDEPTFWVITATTRPAFGYVVSTRSDKGGLSKPRSAEQALPHWSRLTSPSSNWDREHIQSQEEAAFGWPWLVLSWRVDRSVSRYETDRRLDRIAYGLKIEASDRVRALPKILPLRPVWPGLLLGSVVYALILWAVAKNLVALVRLRRLLRGRCYACGYDIKWDLVHGCPECGWRREDVS